MADPGLSRGMSRLGRGTKPHSRYEIRSPVAFTWINDVEHPGGEAGRGWRPRLRRDELRSRNLRPDLKTARATKLPPGAAT